MGLKGVLKDSWLKLAVLLAGILLSGAAFLLVYVERATYVRPGIKIEKTLNTEVMVSANSIVKSLDYVIGIQIVSFNLPKNTRSMVHTFMDSEELNKLYSDHSSTAISGNYPIFTDDQKNNARIIRLLNHEFVCTPFSESITSKIIPYSNKYITTICAVAIPPSYGAFSGIIAVLLTRPPTEAEMSYLRTKLNRLSADIGYL